MGSEEDDALAPEPGGPQVLAAELAQARSMLDAVTARLAVLPAGERLELERELERIRHRWGDAKESFDAARIAGGELGADDERDSRMALDDVQNGLRALVDEVKTRYARYPPGPAT
jgi:hypothetical protein